MIILNIAEKPSVAKSISNLLSRSIIKLNSLNKFTPVYKFDFNNDEMIFTSLLGHLFNLDFVNASDWNSINPKLLFTQETKKFVNKDQENIKKNIQNLCYKVNKIIIWTDCDREGENIGKEIFDVVREKSNVQVKRARFNAITYTNIISALNNLVEINLKESNAVDARIELDLRLGSAFTRIQSLNIKRSGVISYGPCQIPTLGFVVERMREIESFVEENFYTLNLEIMDNNKKIKNFNENNTKVIDIFHWKRGNIYDKNFVVYMKKLLSTEKSCIITKIETKNTEKIRPLPLRTVEFQKSCASIFRISSHEVMQIAENLYNRGFISYPRTETDSFPNLFNFKEILKQLENVNSYSDYVKKLDNNLFVYPRKGKNDDMAHSPIYPLKSGLGLEGNQWKVYDFIARRFLGCISKNALGEECKIEALVGREIFSICGLKILQKNYLEIYTFDKWSQKKINQYTLNMKIPFESGSEFIGKIITEQGKTTPPNYITEPELITLMDKNGIGTDATIAEHIQKILDRKYIYKSGLYFKATGLGLGLINAYDKIGLVEIYKPFLRCKLEENLKKVCEGRTDKNKLVSDEIEIYSKLYDKVFDGINIIKETIMSYENNNGDDNDSNDNGGNLKKRKYIEIQDSGKKRSIKIVKEKKYVNYDLDNEIDLKIFKSNSKTIRDHKSELKTYHEKKKTLKKCICGKEARKNKITKAGENFGKEFFGCADWPNGCNFYLRNDDNEEKENVKNVIKCLCNYETKIKIANTENNKGRKFHACNKAYKQCKFFKWDDET